MKITIDITERGNEALLNLSDKQLLRATLYAAIDIVAVRDQYEGPLPIRDVNGNTYATLTIEEDK